MNILILDHDIFQIESLTRALRSKGHQVLQGSTSQETLDIIRNNEGRINLILTDYALPIPKASNLMDYLEEYCKNLPIIMMTSSADKSQIINPLSSLCKCFLEKPFSHDELLQLVERWK